jgi:ankyrin repeat protein
VKKLVVAGAEVNHRDEDGWTPLHSAAEAGAHEVVRLLLAHGADPALETYDTDTPLAFAANAETARLLRRALGEPDDQSDDVEA